MRKRIVAGVFSIVLLISMIVPVFAAEVEEPTITAEGAIVYCENTGEIVYEKNKDSQYFPYSTTKVLTALLAIQNLPLDQEITVSAAAASQKGSTMGLVEGQVVTVEDLLYGTMLPSGNDAAYALAEAVSGNTTSFIELMNTTAENIGCKHTNFTSVNGLNNEDNLTTAYDMMQIVKVAFSNETLKKISGTKEYALSGTDKKIETHIDLIKDEKSGVYAAKTGYWDANNASIIVGYQLNGLNLYIVLLNDTAKGRDDDIASLIDYTTKTVQGAQVVKKDVAAGKVRIKHGVKTRLETYTAGVGYAYLPKEASDKLISTKVVMDDDIKAPVKAGKVVGTYQIYVADDLVNEVPLIIKEDVDEGWIPSYIGISNLSTIIVGVTAGILLIVVIIILIIRAKNKHKRRKLKEKRLMEIARREAEIERERKERDWTF